MLKDYFKQTKTAEDKKEIDQNGFWYLYDNPITKVGIFPYLGRQISPELEPDKIYQVLRPKEELTKSETLKSFKNKPLINDHTMLGKDNGFTPAEKKGIHGNLGENVKFDEEKQAITNNIAVYSEELKNLIDNGKVELSLGYSCKYDLTPGEFNGQHYDAVQRDIYLNHIALVDEGRMGHDVRIMDCACDSFKEVLEIEKQQKEQEMTEENKPTQDVDKRKLIDDVGGFLKSKGLSDEDIRFVIGKMETESYNPSESGANDEGVNIAINQGKEEEPEQITPTGDEEPQKPCGDEDVDKRKLIDERGGMLKGKVDEETWRTVIGTAEKLAYNDSETGANDEDPEEEKEEEEKPVSMDEAIKYMARKDELVKMVRPYIGDFQHSAMNIKEVVKYAADKMDIPASEDAIKAYVKAKAVPASKISMDSMFTPKKQSTVLAEYKKQSK